MVKYIPDRLSIMTYLSQFYQALVAPKNKGTLSIYEYSLSVLSGTSFLRTAGHCSFIISSNNNKAVEITFLTVQQIKKKKNIHRNCNEEKIRNNNSTPVGLTTTIPARGGRGENLRQ